MWNARWIASHLLLLLVGSVQLEIVHSNVGVQRRKLRGKRTFPRRLNQPPYTFELACKLKLNHGELTDHAFAQFVSSFCHDNAPGPACSDYSFRELPLAIKIPFVSNACPEDPKQVATCLHDLMTSNEQLTFTGDINELCSITQKMMQQNLLILDDLPRLKHYYGDEMLPPESKVHKSPKHDSVVLKPGELRSQDKSVKLLPTKVPTKYNDKSQSDLDQDGNEKDAESPGGSKKTNVKEKKYPEEPLTSAGTQLPAPSDTYFGKADNGHGPDDAKKVSTQSNKSGKRPVFSTPTIIVSDTPSLAPQIQESKAKNVGGDFQEAGNPGRGPGDPKKQTPKGKTSTKTPTSTVAKPKKTTAPSSPSNVENDLELVMPTPIPAPAPAPAPIAAGKTSMAAQVPTEVVPFDFAGNLNRDTDLGINLGKYANESVEEETVESSDSSVTALVTGAAVTGAAVIAFCATLTVAKIQGSRKRKRKELFSLNDPALYEDPSVTSERSYTQDRHGESIESPARSQLKSSAKSFRSITPEASLLSETVGAVFGSPGSFHQEPDAEAQEESHKILESRSFAYTKEKEDIVYLEDTKEPSDLGNFNDDDIVSISTQEGNKRDVLANNRTTETIVEILATAEDQKLMLTSLKQKSYFVGESLLNENAASSAPSEAGPRAIERSRCCGDSKPSAEQYICPKPRCTNVEQNSVGLRLNEYRLPNQVEDNGLSRSSSFSFTKADKRDLEDISEEVNNDDKRPWRRVCSSLSDHGRSRSDTEENAVTGLCSLGVASMLKPTRNRSQSADSALTDELSLDGESFLSEEVLRQFRAVDRRLSEGFKEFKETDIQMNEGYAKLQKDLTDDEFDDDDDEEIEEIDDMSDEVESHSSRKAKLAAAVSEAFEEASYASSCPVIGDVVEDFDGLSGLDRKSASSDGSCTQDGKKTNDVGPKGNNSSKNPTSSGSDSSGSECKPKVTEANGEIHGSLGSSDEDKLERTEDDVNVNDDNSSEDDEQEISDFGSLRSHFAASWYHPVQHHVSNRLRPSTPRRLNNDEDFVGNQPASLLAPVLSSDEESN